MSRLLTAKEVAARLSVAPKTVRIWLKDGKIPGIVLPDGGLRFKEDQIESWINKNSIRQRAFAN